MSEPIKREDYTIVKKRKWQYIYRNNYLVVKLPVNDDKQAEKYIEMDTWAMNRLLDLVFGEHIVQNVGSTVKLKRYEKEKTL